MTVDSSATTALPLDKASETSGDTLSKLCKRNIHIFQLKRIVERVGVESKITPSQSCELHKKLIEHQPASGT